jgi:hypothetical protein
MKHAVGCVLNVKALASGTLFVLCQWAEQRENSLRKVTVCVMVLIFLAWWVGGTRAYLVSQMSCPR